MILKQQRVSCLYGTLKRYGLCFLFCFFLIIIIIFFVMKGIQQAILIINNNNNNSKKKISTQLLKNELDHNLFCFKNYMT